MSRRIDLAGCRFDRWTVLRRDATKPQYWLCRCECGTEQSVYAPNLKTSESRSCGCLLRDVLIHRNRTHGLSKTAEYKIWADMKKRCSNQSCRAYKDYGGRGIAVCDRWLHDFTAFLADVGPRPSSDHSLDRKDNNGPYSPTNVRWATRIVQANNKRRVRHITVNGEHVRASALAVQNGLQAVQYRKRIHRGWKAETAATLPLVKARRYTYRGETHTVTEWAKLLAITPRTLRSRLQTHGWSIERALTTPAQRSAHA